MATNLSSIWDSVLCISFSSTTETKLIDNESEAILRRLQIDLKFDVPVRATIFLILKFAMIILILWNSSVT